MTDRIYEYNAGTYSFEAENVKSFRDILIPVVISLVETKVKMDDGDSIPKIQLMSAEAIKTMIVESVNFYVHNVLWANKKSKKIYPEALVRQVKYVEYIFEQANRPDMTKEDWAIDELAHSVMIDYVFNMLMDDEGLNIRMKK